MLEEMQQVAARASQVSCIQVEECFHKPEGVGERHHLALHNTHTHTSNACLGLPRHTTLNVSQRRPMHVLLLL